MVVSADNEISILTLASALLVSKLNVYTSMLKIIIIVYLLAII